MVGEAAFVRMFSIGLLLHEAVYYADWGRYYFSRSFAPAFGIQFGPIAKPILHALYICNLLLLICKPYAFAPRCVLLFTLTLVVGSASLRLSNHLVLSWFLSALIVLRHGAISYGVPILLSGTYLFSSFAKINRDYLSRQKSCGAHVLRLLLREWGIGDAVSSRLSVWIGIYGIIGVEAGLSIAVLLKPVPAWIVFVAIIMHLGFGFLCHVHFSAIMIGCLFYVTGRSSSIPLSWDVIAILLLGGLAGLRFGNWRSYQFARICATSHTIFGIVAAYALIITLTPSNAVATEQKMPFRVLVITAVLVSIFFFNGLAPYLGYKTVFSFLMFSNLRPDCWVHLIILRPLSPFKMDYVKVEATENLPSIQRFENDPQLRRVLSHLLMAEHFLYSREFLRECIRVLNKMGFSQVKLLCVDSTGNSFSLGRDLVNAPRVKSPWFSKPCWHPLMLPINFSELVCE